MNIGNREWRVVQVDIVNVQDYGYACWRAVLYVTVRRFHLMQNQIKSPHLITAGTPWTDASLMSVSRTSGMYLLGDK
jgi:hypothetical protein